MLEFAVGGSLFMFTQRIAFIVDAGLFVACLFLAKLE
jgi:hypothetical protein